MLVERKTGCHYSQVLINISLLCTSYMNAEFTSRVFKIQNTAIKKQTEHTVQKAIKGAGY